MKRVASTLRERAHVVIVELEGQGFDRKQIADAMCDGEYLKKSGLTQDVVEEIFYICTYKTMDDNDLKNSLYEEENQ